MYHCPQESRHHMTATPLILSSGVSVHSHGKVAGSLLSLHLPHVHLKCSQ
uniref:Uncharacterized protein n=1 Tax=Anguilla anguilla TaxID=7936 RepID=A0A0E9QVD9_ANGAN